MAAQNGPAQEVRAAKKKVSEHKIGFENDHGQAGQPQQMAAVANMEVMQAQQRNNSCH